MPAHTSPTLLPHPLALCCHYPVSKCCSASIVATGTVRVNLQSPVLGKFDTLETLYFCSKTYLRVLIEPLAPNLKADLQSLDHYDSKKVYSMSMWSKYGPS